MDIITIDEAISLELKYYYTGVKCKNGHIDKRYINTGVCYACKRDINKRNRTNNPETSKALMKRQYEKYRDKKIQSSYKWAKNNPEKVRETKRKNKFKYKSKYLQAENIKNKEKRDQDPYYRFNRNLSKQIWEILKGKKNGKSWKRFVDFKIDDLIESIEKKFGEGMTWENYGTFWELDHIIPLNHFKSLDITDEEKVRLAWRLDNLQPLECSLNRSKLDKLNFDYKQARKSFLKCQ